MLTLVKLTPDNYPLLTEMLDEWTAAEQTGDIVPYAMVKHDYRDPERYLADLEVTEETETLVPDSTFFCLDTAQNRFVGAVNIRHVLNERLLRDGGHIGDGVRPSCRGQGIGTRMLALALEECHRLGIERVLMVCDKENTASARSIQKNGGVLENEIETDGCIDQRYWIDLGDA